MFKKFIVSQLTAYFTFINDIMEHLVKAKWLLGNFAYSTGSGLSWGAVFDYLKPFAISLTTVYCLIEINKRWAIEGRDISAKSIGAPLFKLILAAGVLQNIQGLTTSLSSTINGMVSRANTLSKSTFKITELSPEELAQNIYDNSGKMSFILLSFFALFVLVFTVLAIAIMLAFMYKAFCFKIEFYFRLCFTSIACADIYSGTNSQAMRWLKSCLGFGLYGMAFILLPSVVASMAGSIIGAEFKDPATLGAEGQNFLVALKCMAMYALAPAVAFGMLGTIKQVTKEVMG